MMIKIKKKLLYTLLILPALIFLLFPTLFDLLGPRPWKTLLVNGGYCTLSFLILSLALAPLSKHFPKLKGLYPHRRAIGVTVFFYASFHLLSVLMKTYEKKGEIPLDYFLRPVVYTGLGAFLILLLLTLTSNNWSVRTLGYSNWKGIHRFVYGAELLVFIHLALQSLPLALSFFVPLVFLQLLRIKYRREF
ncbi:MAG: ferric reductase-like transmembrane domain-containing protein [Chlamydiia bacterium]|nr:ferric reductase-like transmembrane domain-containing protein [Chlamydiia bacterium]